MWSAQRDALLDKARFISFDVRGLGKSPLPVGPMMLEHVVDDLFALLDHLGIRSAMLCGLSMGGYVALRAVQREPARVSGLLLADTQAAADANEAKLKRADGVRKLLRDGVSSYADAFLPGALAKSTVQEAKPAFARARDLVLDSSAAGIAGGLVALATRTDVTAVLPRIAVPTRVLVGEHDAVTPPAVARALSEQIPGSDCHVLAGAGHLANLEAPDAFNRLLLEHVSRVAG